jgi:hypothetical protein
MTVHEKLIQLVDSAPTADWSTRQYLRRLAVAMQARTLNFGHYAHCFRERADDFRKMAATKRELVDGHSEKATAVLYDVVASMFERHADPALVCGEVCGYIHDRIEPHGMTKADPCTCSCHQAHQSD